jgi:predicted SAM-dependent methyltransferase
MKNIKLDLGCGKTKKEGFIGIDILPFDNVDIVHDLKNFPYPFDDNSVDEIWMDNVLEIIPNPIKVVEEIYRIAKPDSKITISVPYYRSLYAFIDPTHINFFSYFWFAYFDPSSYFNQKYKYSEATFKIEKIIFNREWLENYECGFFKKILIKLANKKPEFYEIHLSHLFPLDSLTFYITAIK